MSRPSASCSEVPGPSHVTQRNSFCLFYTLSSGKKGTLFQTELVNVFFRQIPSSMLRMHLKPSAKSSLSCMPPVMGGSLLQSPHCVGGSSGTWEVPPQAGLESISPPSHKLIWALPPGHPAPSPTSNCLQCAGQPRRVSVWLNSHPLHLTHSSSVM